MMQAHRLMPCLLIASLPQPDKQAWKGLLCQRGCNDKAYKHLASEIRVDGCVIIVSFRFLKRRPANQGICDNSKAQVELPFFGTDASLALYGYLLVYSHEICWGMAEGQWWAA
jgi:hypothetical protein